MEKEVISNVLALFKKQEIITYLQRWKRIPSDTIETLVDDENRIVHEKKDLIRIIQNICKQYAVTTEEIGELALLYIVSHYKLKLWTVYKLEAKTGNKVPFVKAEGIKKKLKADLEEFYNKVDVSVSTGSAIWARVYIHDSRKNVFVPGNVSYLVIYPGKTFFIASRMKAAHAPCIIQAVVTLLQCKSAQDLPLQGRCVSSLARLALNKYQPETNTNHGNVMSLNRLKRKKAEEEELHNPAMHDENRAVKRSREEVLLQNYGPEAQPTLEKLTYKLETKFKASSLVPAMSEVSEIFPCKVTFEGSSVLEGIKNLAKAGLAELPMKPHLGRIQTMGKNTIVLGQKPAAEKTAT